MARNHGKNVRVYFDGRDASCDLTDVDVTAGADTHDVTTFCANGWKVNEAGLLGWEVGVSGFYDPAVAGYGRQLEDLLGTTCKALSIYDGNADLVGDSGVLFGGGVIKERNQPINVAEMIKLDGAIEGSGRAGLFGKLLHTAYFTETGTDETVQIQAASANGCRANLHVLAITGTWTIKIQHSDDFTNWVDLITFTQVAQAGGVTAESKEVAGTVNEYVKIIWTEDVAGSITFVCGLARY